MIILPPTISVYIVQSARTFVIIDVYQVLPLFVLIYEFFKNNLVFSLIVFFPRQYFTLFLYYLPISISFGLFLIFYLSLINEVINFTVCYDSLSMLENECNQDVRKHGKCSSNSRNVFSNITAKTGILN